MSKLLIVDGHNLLFRMFYGIPSPILNSEGKDIRAAVGFVGGLLKAIKQFDIDNLIVVFDSQTSTAGRLEIDKEYKSNRIDYTQVPDEENPFTQLAYIYKVLENMKVEYMEVTDHEADDYIASLCSSYSEQEIVILSTDRDFLQLVTDEITVFSPRGKMSIEFTPEKIYEKFIIRPNQVIDYKVLIGDKSDNIVGVKSIGPKTAVRILNEGTLDEILTGETNLDEKLFNKLIENKELISRNTKLITMKRDIEITSSYSNMAIDFDLDQKAFQFIISAGIN